MKKLHVTCTIDKNWNSRTLEFWFINNHLWRYVCILNNHYPQNQSLKHLYLNEDSTLVLYATMSLESFNICKCINCIQTLVVTPDQYPLADCVCPETGPVTKGDNSWSAGWRSSTLRTKACRLECHLKAVNKNTFI